MRRRRRGRAPWEKIHISLFTEPSVEAQRLCEAAFACLTITDQQRRVFIFDFCL